jgi:hypothetical protein
MDRSIPHVGENYFQERRGIHEVDGILINLKLIWRETPNADIGIDGQIEWVDENDQAPGIIVAAQVKSGETYFRNETHDGFNYQPDAKHRQYWERFPIPVILILHNPKTRQCYFVDARQFLRGEASQSSAITVPKSQVLNAENRNKLFEAYGPTQELSALTDVFFQLLTTRTNNPDFDLSYFRLFFGGLTDIGNKLLFSMDLCMDLIEYACASIGIGHDQFEFLDEYVRFISSQRLAFVDYADYIVDHDQRKVVPICIWTLTDRGKMVVRLFHVMATALEGDLSVFNARACSSESDVHIEIEYKLNVLAAIEEFIIKNPDRSSTLFDVIKQHLNSPDDCWK